MRLEPSNVYLLSSFVGFKSYTFLSELVEVAGVEPASVSTLPLALHA